MAGEGTGSFVAFTKPVAPCPIPSKVGKVDFKTSTVRRYWIQRNSREPGEKPFGREDVGRIPRCVLDLVASTINKLSLLELRIFKRSEKKAKKLK